MKLPQATIVTLLLAACAPAHAAEKQVLTVAILDFESRDEAVRDLGSKVAGLINADLSDEPELITVERAELGKVLGEQELGLSGTIAPETAARVGQLTGARVLVTGRVFQAEKDLILVAKIIGTETSRVYGELVKAPASSASITALSAELARKIAATVAQKSETLVAKEETREGLIASIKKAVAGKRLGAVEIRVAERHFGPQRVIDPAVETELALILTQCGFTVVDGKSPTKADIELSGEAFSSFGLRKGNLVSCKARIELKAQKRTGEILAVDRQTTVAVDLTEQTAAKAALQNAAADLAERLIPKCVD